MVVINNRKWNFGISAARFPTQAGSHSVSNPNYSVKPQKLSLYSTEHEMSRL